MQYCELSSVQEPNGLKCREPDSAKRMADGIALHQSVLGIHAIMDGRAAVKHFIAITLADGTVSKTLYDTYQDAVHDNRNAPGVHMFYQLPLERMTEYACDTLLWYMRLRHKNGYRVDPRDDKQLIVPTRMEDLGI